ncbi:DUF3472 domain-containing protein [Armatimonas sp.]|uniref:DUF3472 domain-containing protein n=1 Tax=Armatimonas sp. TaxID=1872638 RepID=UPI00286A9619|nr:DUF3472 domain-containing protein [Armatimonas sp.]
MHQETLRIPAFTAYEEKGTLVWYGEIKQTGPLVFALEGKSSDLFIEKVPATGIREVGFEGFTKTVRCFVGGQGTISVTPGYWRFALKAPGKAEALLLSGPASKDAHFNLKERKNAASVHLSYALEKTTRAEWFYNEITVRTTPLYSYYMACGFARGYFGIQVNSPTERRIIFSIWDSGNEGVDRSKVADEDQVKLLAKGEGVVASGFGNEGTGGHSHLVYPWKQDTTYKFLVHAEPVHVGNGQQTIYSGYFWFPEKRTWGLIARFRAPKDGNYLSGLYSFNENFGGDNGQLLRLAEFGPSWIRTSEDKWQELAAASFSCDATGRAKDRLDFAAGVAKSGRWYLSNGGFVKNGIAYKDPLPPRKQHGKPPETLPA